MKRVLFLGDQNFIVKMGGALSASDSSICYATQTQMAVSLLKDHAIDLVVADIRSVPRSDFDLMRETIQEAALTGIVILHPLDPIDETTVQALIAQLKGG
jgi:DNA-binding response OmpR family regulator